MCSQFVIVPNLLLSGFIFAIDSMPPAMQYFTTILPMRYFLVIVRGNHDEGLGLSATLGTHRGHDHPRCDHFPGELAEIPKDFWLNKQSYGSRQPIRGTSALMSNVVPTDMFGSYVVAISAFVAFLLTSQLFNDASEHNEHARRASQEATPHVHQAPEHLQQPREPFIDRWSIPEMHR